MTRKHCKQINKTDKIIRDTEIRKQYHEMRSENVCQYDAFEKLSIKYKLSIDTIRHIITNRKVQND